MKSTDLAATAGATGELNAVRRITGILLMGFSALLLFACVTKAPDKRQVVATEQVETTNAEKTVFRLSIAVAEAEAPTDTESPLLDQFLPKRLFEQYCMVCHGEKLQGSAQGVALVGVAPIHGNSVSEIVELITNGVAEKGMPTFDNIMSIEDITNVAMYVAEQRLNYNPNEYAVAESIVVPTDEQSSAKEQFCLKTVAEDLDVMPFSITHLPDGNILVSEKTKCIRLISPSGQLGPYISNTPKVYEDTVEPDFLGGLSAGYGWMAEVAAHLDYEENGWIYLSFGDR